MTLLDEVIAGASGDTRISSLLRQVKILASRTGAEPLGDWIDQELNGYPDDAVLPSYRGPFAVHVLGHFVGLGGQQAENVQIPRSSYNKELEADGLFEVGLREPIAAIESMAIEEHVTLAWNAEMVGYYNTFVRTGKVRPLFEGGGMHLVGAKIHISRHLLAGALDGVRNRILDLTLQLEKIVPDAGQTSTPEAEQGFAGIIINNYFQASSNVAINSTDVRQSIKPPAKGDVNALVSFLREMGLSSELLTELRAAVESDEQDHGEGSGRWKRVRAWFARVATDAGTEAIGGAVATAAVGFLGG